jgi:hypothetical protein
MFVNKILHLVDARLGKVEPELEPLLVLGKVEQILHEGGTSQIEALV